MIVNPFSNICDGMETMALMTELTSLMKPFIENLDKESHNVWEVLHHKESPTVAVDTLAVAACESLEELAKAVRVATQDWEKGFAMAISVIERFVTNQISIRMDTVTEMSRAVSRGSYDVHDALVEQSFQLSALWTLFAHIQASGGTIVQEEPSQNAVQEDRLQELTASAA